MSGALRPGTLFAIVGPSGAGKDTLIAAAQAALAGDQRYVFARRVITRPADAGGEAHEAVTRDEFTRLADIGAFALTWSAHGLDYGIRGDLAAILADRRHVVVNLSRAVVAAARAQFAATVVIEITAAPEVLARRLAARGREDPGDIARRLARPAPLAPSPDIRRIDNSAALEPAVTAFLAALRAPGDAGDR